MSRPILLVGLAVAAALLAAVGDPARAQSPSLRAQAVPLAPAPTKICVDKYHDLNGNRARDAGEPPLAGFKFLLIATNGNGSTHITDASGTACFTLFPGTYRVIETPAAGWVNTDPGTAAIEKSVTVALGNTVRVAFGNRPAGPTKICVDKYHDLDGNRSRDAGEPPLAGFKFLLIATNGNGSTHITDASGTACFTLFPGTYRVRETPAAGWVNTDPGTAAIEKSVTVALGNTVRVAFGNRPTPPAPPTQICVDNFNDLNGSTQRNPGEPPLPGFAFTLFDPSNKPSTGTTDASGSVCFTVAPGNYRVAETLLPGWINTNPSASLEKSVSATLGNTVRVAFGNMSASSPSFDLSPHPGMPLGPSGHASLERIFTVTIWDRHLLTIPAGSKLIVRGSISPNTLFGPYTPINGWFCPVLDPTGFTCMTSTTVPATRIKLELSTHGLVPAPWGPVHLNASVSMDRNNDPDPSNDSISWWINLW